MVEFVKFEQKINKTINPRTRIKLILWTYIINIIFFVLLFDLYGGGFLKWFTFGLIISFFLGILQKKTNIYSINGWVIVYAIIHLFIFGIRSTTFTLNILLLIMNLLYIKYILKNLTL